MYIRASSLLSFVYHQPTVSSTSCLLFQAITIKAKFPSKAFHFHQTNPVPSRAFSMSSKKILLVFGATGAQGGSVVDAVLRDSQLSSEYNMRGITRDPSKSKGQELARRGVEPVTVRLLIRELPRQN